MDSHRPLVQQIPQISLDAFKVCFYKRWPLGELLFVGLATAFGTLSPSNFYRDFASGILMYLTPHTTRVVAS